jgi:alpha-glucosidase
MTSDSFAWWQTGVIYQIYPRSFKDSNGDGVGDLQGIIDKLDYLNGKPDSLGIDTIWISPIYPSPMADFGYDVADYVDIHPIFGDLATFDRLVAEAHKRDIRVILDFVPNHTSDEHEWFIESRSSRDNPKRDWYIWRDPKADGDVPNNWVSMFGGRAWEWDATTGQYYLHLFDKRQPDLNWRNPAVKSAMFDVIRFWLDRGVDGFRVDVVGFIVKDEEQRDNPLSGNINGDNPNNQWGHQQHIYDIDQPGAHDIIREMRRLHDAAGDRVLIGEVWAEPRSRWAEYYGRQNDELHLPFNFDLLEKPWDATAIRRSIDELEATLQPGMYPNYVLGSHDKRRLATRYGEHAIRVAAMLLLTLRGVPTLYMGDEIGMMDGEIPSEYIQDPQGVNLGADMSRDPCRTPFQWSAQRFAGFSDVDPWLPVADGYEQCNLDTQAGDPMSVFALYQALLRYRRQSSALRCGTYAPLDVISSQRFAYLRDYQGERLLILLNFSGDDLRLNMSSVAETGRVVISTNLDRNENIQLADVALRPHEGIIVALENQ